MERRFGGRAPTKGAGAGVELDDLAEAGRDIQLAVGIGDPAAQASRLRLDFGMTFARQIWAPVRMSWAVTSAPPSMT